MSTAIKLAAAPTPEKPVAKSDRFPAGIPFIVLNEGAERFSFYGMKAILKIYLISLFVRFVDESMIGPAHMAVARAKSTEVVHLFVAGVYAFPLIGAVLADRLLGKYRVIFWVSLIYCAGHAVLAVAGRLGALGIYEAAEMSMYLGLGLIAIGSGGIKPCVSANVGDQFTKENGHLVTQVFQIFYFIINYGSFFSTIITPLLLRYTNAEIAFGVPGVLMGIATFFFWLGGHQVKSLQEFSKKSPWLSFLAGDKFAKIPPKPGGKLGLYDTAVTVLLFSPLFALIVGYFFLWEHHLTALQAALPQGQELQITMATVGSYLAAYWWLPTATIAAMVAGFVLFGMRQRLEADRASFLPVLLYSLRNQKQRQPGEGFFGPARRAFGEEAADGPPAVLRIMLVFSMVSVFWALFDQHASTWVDQARMMRLDMTVPAFTGYWAVAATLALSVWAGLWLVTWISNIKLPRRATLAALGIIGGTGLLAAVLDAFGPPMGDIGADGLRARLMTINMDAAQLSALNPLMVMMIIPGLNILVYAPLAKRGIEIRPLQKMTIGMFLASVAFASAALLQVWVEKSGNGVVHGLWQAGPYFLMTIAEVLVSITGLEFAYTQAPRAMKSTIMSFWLLCVTFGNLIVAFLAPLQKSYELSAFFWLFAGLMAVAAFVFAVMAYFYKGKAYLQEASGH